MKSLDITYSHEFISNKIKDELILNNIWNFKEIELSIIETIISLFNFNIGKDRNINTLSGGQRSITFLITLSYICQEKGINNLRLNLTNIIESLTDNTANIAIDYLKSRGLYVN